MCSAQRTKRFRFHSECLAKPWRSCTSMRSSRKRTKIYQGLTAMVKKTHSARLQALFPSQWESIWMTLIAHLGGSRVSRALPLTTRRTLSEMGWAHPICVQLPRAHSRNPLTVSAHQSSNHLLPQPTPSKMVSTWTLAQWGTTLARRGLGRTRRTTLTRRGTWRRERQSPAPANTRGSLTSMEPSENAKRLFGLGQYYWNCRF